MNTLIRNHKNFRHAINKLIKNTAMISNLGLVHERQKSIYSAVVQTRFLSHSSECERIYTNNWQTASIDM